MRPHPQRKDVSSVPKSRSDRGWMSTQKPKWWRLTLLFFLLFAVSKIASTAGASQSGFQKHSASPISQERPMKTSDAQPTAEKTELQY